MRSGVRGHPVPPSAVRRWLVVLPILLAVFALHAMTAENPTPLTAPDSPVAVAGPVDLGDPTTWLIAAPVPVPASSLANAPITPLQDFGAAGCLLFLAALWVLAVLRRWIPLRPPTLAARWPGACAGPPMWPVTRLSLGVTRI